LRRRSESALSALDPGLLERIGQQGDVALQIINADINRQALFIAYLDDFKLMMILTFAALPLVAADAQGAGQRCRPAMAAD
jgi:MFS transporter, DHA2 family, multidrug resistance protein